MIPTETDFEAQVSMETEAIPMPEEPPFHILLLGDYSGVSNTTDLADVQLPKPRPLEIDRDNFDEVLKRLNVGLHLKFKDSKEGALTLRFKELEDFHPDSILKNIPIFADLRDVRKRLLNADTFDQAAAEVRSWFGPEEGGGNKEEDAQTKGQDHPAAKSRTPPRAGGELSEEEKTPAESSGNLLDDILGQKKISAEDYKSQESASPELSAFIRDIVRPHVVRTDEAEQAEMLAVADEATSSLMRKILNHPDFKALESAWRGLYFLVRRAETNESLKLFILDITKQEITETLKNVSDLTDSDLYKTLITETVQTPGGIPWSLICGNYEFELSVEDSATLIRLAKLGSFSNAPFISSVKPQMLGIESLAALPDARDWNYKDASSEGKLWTMLRTIPEAKYLGLAVPRFLARYPYGTNTEPASSFDFEEFTEKLAHEDYLWSNPSFLIALLFAQSFSASGWEMNGRFYNELNGFPVHIYEIGSETKTKPCSEILITENALEILLDQGLMPLVTFRDTDRIKIARFQSVAFPEKPLKGRWN